MSNHALIACVHVLCSYVSVPGSGDTYLLREERDDLSADGTETLDNLRLQREERERERERRYYSIRYSKVVSTRRGNAAYETRPSNEGGVPREETWGSEQQRTTRRTRRTKLN